MKAEGIQLSHEFADWIQALPGDERVVFYRHLCNDVGGMLFDMRDDSPALLEMCGGTLDEQPGDPAIFERAWAKFPELLHAQIAQLDSQATVLGVTW